MLILSCDKISTPFGGRIRLFERTGLYRDVLGFIHLPKVQSSFKAIKSLRKVGTLSV